MEQLTLRAAERTESGSRPARRLRRAGRVPANIYGRGMNAQAVTVDRKELYTVLHTEAGLNALINVEIEGADALLTVAREIQRHPVRGEISHLDFIRVALDEAIEADVSLEPQGIPVGVYQDGGFVEAIATMVNISALPMAIPTSIEYDISEMHIGDTMKVSDLPAIEGVEYLDDPDRPVLSVLAPRVEEEPEALEGEELEGELAEAGEEGAAEGESADTEGEE
jgi:large subunit ribosomal protein L25